MTTAQEPTPIVVRIGDADFTFVYESDGNLPGTQYFVCDLQVGDLRLPAAIRDMANGVFEASCCTRLFDAEGVATASDPETAMLIALADLTEDLKEYRDEIDANIATIAAVLP